jgi:formiminotetrahydrofolate cyclodeaminase
LTEQTSATSLAQTYLEQLASPAPTPGGGSASAVGAALGVALLEMVATLSQQSADAERQPILTELGTNYRAQLRRLIELGAGDEDAYGGYRQALALPKANEEEKARRREALQRATIASARVPLDIAELALDALRGIPDLAAVSSSYLRADLATAAHLLAGAAFGALVMVDTNLGSIKDEAISSELTTRRNATHDATGAALNEALSAST